MLRRALLLAEPNWVPGTPLPLKKEPSFLKKTVREARSAAVKAAIMGDEATGSEPKSWMESIVFVEASQKQRKEAAEVTKTVALRRLRQKNRALWQNKAFRAKMRDPEEHQAFRDKTYRKQQAILNPLGPVKRKARRERLERQRHTRYQEREATAAEPIKPKRSFDGSETVADEFADDETPRIIGVPETNTSRGGAPSGPQRKSEYPVPTMVNTSPRQKEDQGPVRQRQHRKRSMIRVKSVLPVGEQWIVGEQGVLHCLLGNRRQVRQLLLREDLPDSLLLQLQSLADEKNIPCKFVSFDAMAANVSQPDRVPVIAVTGPRLVTQWSPEPPDQAEKEDKGSPPVWLVVAEPQIDASCHDWWTTLFSACIGNVDKVLVRSDLSGVINFGWDSTGTVGLADNLDIEQFPIPQLQTLVTDLQELGWNTLNIPSEAAPPLHTPDDDHDTPSTQVQAVTAVEQNVPTIVVVGGPSTLKANCVLQSNQTSLPRANTLANAVSALTWLKLIPPINNA
eukprot:TRINITY_DN67768_c10_g1_i5.p1 TRINITY_DN67768_c10_g1~~TRINITY_DN67768_c10_g1_i5.p1  ORF type:complete len:510 (+),score=42.04 TRINITY_DN67768_c10_g1_i5:62-1591(+)